MFTSLTLARLSPGTLSTAPSIPGTVRFLLTCNYRVKDLENMPLFYGDILLYCQELKTLYGYHVGDKSYLIIRKFVSRLKLFSGRNGLRKALKELKIF